MATQKHRSHWTARVQDPTLNPHRFLPTPVPSKPISKIKEPPVFEEVERDFSPPTCARDPGAFCILDRYNDYRAYISPDGTCANNANQIIGYINLDSSQAGSADQEYLGCVNADWQVEDDEDEPVGLIDPGRALLRDYSGSIVAEFDNTGSIKGEDGSYLGQFEGFNYRSMKTISLYLMFIDPGMLSCIEG